MLSFKAFYISLIFAGLSLASYSQLGGGMGGFGKNDTSNKKLKLAAFPYLNYNRTQEFMYGAVGLGMFKINRADTISPKSMVGVVVIGTTTNTWGAMAFSQLYFKEDRWRATIYGGYFSFNYQFYWSPVPNAGTFVQYNTGYSMIYGKMLRKITKQGKNRKLYGGLHATIANANSTYKILDSSIKASPTQLNNVGLDLDYDSRDNVYYPTYGFYADAVWDWNADWLGNRNSFNKLKFSINNYNRWNKRIIQATRLHASFGIGNVPFEGQEIIGQTDIRGYSSGKQRGNQLVALQTESRIHIWKRISAVAFAGVAATTDDVSDFSWDNLWPGLGGGLRVLVMKEEKLNIGLDVAAGRDDWSMSFTIGEVF